jgi:multiple sugar transport system substrate-binding protein
MNSVGKAVARQSAAPRPARGGGDHGRPTRRAVLAAAAGLAGVMAAACTPGGGGAGPSKFTRQVTLEWAVWQGPTLLDAARQGIRIFTEKHPALTINLVSFNSQDENTTKWLAGTGPHVAMTWSTTLVDFGRRGQFLSLDQYLKRDSRAVSTTDYADYHLKAIQWQGVGQFALPMYSNLYGLYYNKKVFQQKGVALPDDTWDWRKYQDAMLRLTDKAQGVWGALDQGISLGANKVLQNDANMVDPKDDRKAAFTSPGALEALQWTHDRLWRDRTMAQTADRNAAGFNSPFAMLAAGKVAMIEQGSYAPADFARDFPDAVNDWDIALLPQGKKRVSNVAIDSWTIQKTAPPEEAWEFLKFLQSTEWLDVQAGVASYQHPRISMQDRYVEVIKKNRPALAGKNLQAFAHPLKNRYARPREIFRKDADAWRIIGEAWAATMTRNEQQVTPAFQDAARLVDAAMLG